MTERFSKEWQGLPEGMKPPLSINNASSRRFRAAGLWIASLVLLMLFSCVWLALKADEIRRELEASRSVASVLNTTLANFSSDEASKSVKELRQHTTAARKAAEDPLWTLAASIPLLGANFSAVAEVARSVDDIAGFAITPLVDVYASLHWESLLPTGSGADVGAIKRVAPSISKAAHAVQSSRHRLAAIDQTVLVPQVTEPLNLLLNQLDGVASSLDAGADVAKLAPDMLGGSRPREYLLMIQNNAEARASGGIPGALAALRIENGKMTLGVQSNAVDVGVMSPVVPVDPLQQHIYSSRLGEFMQDVNLTPDFPTAASTAQAMWERKTGRRVDGVISIDPVALGYVLDATGPVDLKQDELLAIANAGLPTQLTGANVVQTLLSDVYTKIEQPDLQDAYFAGVAQEIFAALSAGKVNAQGLLASLERAAKEGRLLVWSGLPAEQSLINQYALSGSVAGPSIAPAQFGVYFNDGTGAKMDYFVKRTVQLVKECPRDGYEQTTVRITSTNGAPGDAATSLPAYVTGDGKYGVPPGSVETNIIAYGPVQANAETAKVDGQPTGFAPYLHSNRPVGVVAIRLAPGESRTVEFTFGKIVQHTEPNVAITPTVEDVEDVTLPTLNGPCS